MKKTSKAKNQKLSAEEIALNLEIARWEKREALKTAFGAIEAQCNLLFNQGSHLRHAGHMDAFLVCASALDNAGDTAVEQKFELESLEYWECALGSLESLVCYEKPRVRRWFKKCGLKF
jgi:hypothetical protein